MSQYEDVAAMTRTIHQRLQESLNRAKVFNHRELLCELGDTDYTDLGNMNKEFMPYYNLWTTIDLWKKSHKSWLEDGFEALDA
jgi:dynein heavy chain